MATSNSQDHYLTTGWFWKQRRGDVDSVLDELHIQNETSLGEAINANEDQWTIARTFPSEIHVELIKSGRIADPYIGFNEHDVQWVGEKDWLYKCEFPKPPVTEDEHCGLEFEGLDTICDVYLNGQTVLSTDNQFRTYQIDIPTDSLLPTNTILLHFKSAARTAIEREKQYGQVRGGSVNLGHASRVYVRKAQYDWRWDWGPELMTVGPYRPVVLRTYITRIASVHAHAIVSQSLSPSLGVGVTLTGTVNAARTIRINLRDPQQDRDVRCEEVPIPAGNEGPGISTRTVQELVKWDLEGNVELWWPVGYGEQKLYKVVVTLLGEDSVVLYESSQHIGFRRVVLIQEQLLEPDEHGTGTTFLFKINNVRMFIGGSNWIPADNFLTTITEERYRAWLTLLKQGGQNMVRLWGGGVYEPDAFYDICDELGILVWQDFQFSCGVYPAHDEFVESVKREAEENVARLRRHPSLALFCGNNEDYQQVLQWGGITELPARKLYEHVLPDIIERLAPGVPYHWGSPYGGIGWDTSDPTTGDVHVWDVWAGKERPWQDYAQLGGRFVSEFGVPAMPDIRTVKYWMKDAGKGEWYAQSRTMAQHNRAGSFERRFSILMGENFKLTADLETHIFNTQILQSEAVSFAYRVWRRNWGGNGKQYTGGVIVWQLNDCWPVTSWAIVDYFLRPKPAYYAIARELKPVSIGILRTVTKNRPNDRPRQFYEFGAFRTSAASFEVWGTNGGVDGSLSGSLEIRAFDLSNPNWSHYECHKAILQPNQATELLHLSCPDPGQGYGASVVISVRLIDDESGSVLARAVDWPQPFRFLEFPDPGLHFKVHGEHIIVRVEKPVKGLVLGVDSEGGNEKQVTWSDNNLDVVPEDDRVIQATGLEGGKITVAYMGKERASCITAQVTQA